MKQYNSDNFNRYKKDVKASQPEGKFWDEYTRDELIIKFMPLVENIARKFKDSDAANGVVSLSDRIQFGHIGLIKAVDKIVWKQILTSKDPYLHSKLHNIIRNIMLKALTDKEYHVIRLSYGINCDKLSAKQIAKYLNMDGVSSYVRVSQLKKQAINKLKSVMSYSQVADYL